MHGSAGMRRRLRGALVALAIVAVLASPFFYDRYFRVLPSELAVVVDGFSCVAPGAVSVMGGGDYPDEFAGGDAIPAAGSVPESFAPVEVVFCALGENDVVTGSITVLEEHRTGDLGATLDALAAPSRPQSWFSACTVSAVPPPLVWLVDDGGRAVRPLLPLEPECGLTAYGPIRAIQELNLVTSVQHAL